MGIAINMSLITSLIYLYVMSIDEVVMVEMPNCSKIYDTTSD
ncbi:MAG: hypothetical protein BWX61_00961 [Bacteroidetes bacterium ADurb.Bin035]|nr:MAG: hypothetical protein BWX61_00961 [Bacteroidetes bacterium ADurb.Bin035]